MAKLALVPTPIGNLEDITLRAIRYLKEADIIFAEDTRVTQKLLKYLGIQQKVISFHAHNEHRFLEKSVQFVEESELVVLVSDAGTPAISDPGFLLVRACLQKNISIECLPGPCALIPAIVGSGFPCDKFIFEGFLPHKKGRQTRLKELSSEDRTIIFYESPHRLLKTLEQMLPFFSESRQICVVRELSKMFETYHRGTLTEQIAYFKETAPRGEIVLLVHGVD
jgi:16S rRNA (cytidine1402-2'-O)-methyltransferase